MGDDTTSRPSKRARVIDASDAPTLQCQVCHRSYERLDHLNRHLDSHRNERCFRCEECPAAFNRRDLLLRHKTTHAKNAQARHVNPRRAIERATKACDSCVISKVKCDNSRPCKRCRNKDIACTTRHIPRSSGIESFDSQEQQTADIAPPFEQRLSDISPEVEAPSNAVNPEDAFDELNTEPPQGLTSYQDFGTQQHSIHNFFEQIMVMEPNFPDMEYLQQPPNLTSWLPEIDWYNEVDIFGHDFAPAIDETFHTPSVDTDALGTATTPQINMAGPGRENNSGEAVRRRHAVFKQSPWFYIPEQHQDGFSDAEGITLDERHVDLAASPHQPYASNVVIPGRLSQQGRDSIFQLVSKAAHNKVSIPSFPSADCLDKLLKVGIAKRTETDAWIHPYTFDSESSRPEFLTALVVAGCVCFGIPSVNKTGLVLHEIARISLRDLAERDSSVMQDIQYLQASMLWLDIGAFCGFKHKMQIAESSLQALVTVLRRAGRFDDVRYPLIIPTTEDDGEELDKKWRQWVEYESYKRLIYHLLDHDMYMTMINHRQPLLSYAELTLPLPASKNLWLAPSAKAWRTQISRMTAVETPRPSLRSILQTESAILCLSPGVDVQIARNAYLHGLAAQSWEYTQQKTLLQENGDPASQLWSRSRHNTLYQSLQHSTFSLSKSQAVTCVLQQFLMMYLHVDLDTVARFAGRCGEEAAHRAYKALLSWYQTKDARIAISHAALVLDATRHIHPYQNRGQDSLIIYHAIMVLWAYSMMRSDSARKTGANTPTIGLSHAAQLSLASLSSAAGTGAPTSPTRRVFLDDSQQTNQAMIDAFILMNAGVPSLRVNGGKRYERGANGLETEDRSAADVCSEICDLRIPSQVLKAGVSLLDGTHPDVDRQTGPPLLRALCGLMEELGGLS